MADSNRQKALDRLEHATGLGIGSPARSVYTAEAQVYATLALSDPPPKLEVPAVAEDAFRAAMAPLVTAESAKPAPKKKAPAKKKAEPKPDEVVPGSEEDVIRKEAAK